MNKTMEKTRFNKDENIFLHRVLNQQLDKLQMLKRDEFLVTSKEKTTKMLEEITSFYDKLLYKIEMLTDIDEKH
jgi:hypothetical protein